MRFLGFFRSADSDFQELGEYWTKFLAMRWNFLRYRRVIFFDEAFSYLWDF